MVNLSETPETENRDINPDSSETGMGYKNETDNLLFDLRREEYALMPTNKDETIAWVLWHIARIEDLTSDMKREVLPVINQRVKMGKHKMSNQRSGMR